MRRINKAYFILVAMTLIWGTSFPAIKQALKELTVSQLLLSRFLIAYLALLGVGFILRLKSPKVAKRDLVLLIVLTLIEPIVYFIFETSAINLTSAINVSILIALTPLSIAINAHLFLNEKPHKLFYPGLIVSIIGVGFALAGGGEQISLKLGVGEVLALGAVIVVSFYVLIAGDISRRLSAYYVTRFQLGLTTGFFFVWCAFFDGVPSVVTISPIGWICVLGLGLFASAFGYFGLNYAYSKVPGRHVALIGNFIPIVTLFVSAALPGGKLMPVQVIGIFVAFAGLWICSLKAKAH